MNSSRKCNLIRSNVPPPKTNLRLAVYEMFTERINLNVILKASRKSNNAILCLNVHRNGSVGRMEFLSARINNKKKRLLMFTYNCSIEFSS